MMQWLQLNQEWETQMVMSLSAKHIHVLWVISKHDVNDEVNVTARVRGNRNMMWMMKSMWLLESGVNKHIFQSEGICDSKTYQICHQICIRREQCQQKSMLACQVTRSLVPWNIHVHTVYTHGIWGHIFYRWFTKDLSTLHWPSLRKFTTCYIKKHTQTFSGSNIHMYICTFVSDFS